MRIITRLRSILNDGLDHVLRKVAERIARPACPCLTEGALDEEGEPLPPGQPCAQCASRMEAWAAAWNGTVVAMYYLMAFLLFVAVVRTLVWLIPSAIHLAIRLLVAYAL
jgi:hypothetical protein